MLILVRSVTFCKALRAGPSLVHHGPTGSGTGLRTRRGATAVAELMRKDLDAFGSFCCLLEDDLYASWPQVEQFLNVTIREVRVELPGIDPEQDMELTGANDTLRLRAWSARKTGAATVRSSVTGPSPASCPCRPDARRTSPPPAPTGCW